MSGYPEWFGDKIARLDANLEAQLAADPDLLAAVESDAVQADLAAHDITWSNVDSTIRLHSRRGITEPWNEWEWPRRMAWYRKLNRDALARMAQGKLDVDPA